METIEEMESAIHTALLLGDAAKILKEKPCLRNYLAMIAVDLITTASLKDCPERIRWALEIQKADIFSKWDRIMKGKK